MNVYKVEITEILQRQVDINAKDELSAWEKVDELYRNQKIVLDADDYVNTEINVLSDMERPYWDEKVILNTLRYNAEMLVSTYDSIIENNENLYLAIKNVVDILNKMDEEGC